ncbi:MAG: cob(I)yrinic acid a,c-diamide adenosyltransferase [Gemmataceae bacterium]|nr:cob(I)yrinic acid a,c-diamide adenosyltransferase [Gemmataceae bacterium]
MVYLSRIYTRVGDQGKTALGSGDMVPKNHPRVTAMGSVDELNSLLGVLASQLPPGPDHEFLREVQNNLFDLGADLCLPIDTAKAGESLRIGKALWEKLEKKIDQWNEKLQPLTSFILPGGSQVSCWTHLARAVCRRAERDLVTLASQEAINPDSLIFLNRLSDLFFVMARIYNNQGRNDILWVPGKTSS